MDLVPVLPKIMRFARTLTSSKADAEDLVQRTCERALTRADQFRPDGKLESWLYRIMQTIWIDEVRARAVRLRHVASVPRDELSNSVDGERHMEAALVLDRVRSEVQTMPATDRQLLMMICVENLSYREAAETLGIPIGTVMSRLSRARSELAARLELTGRSETSGTTKRGRALSSVPVATTRPKPCRMTTRVLRSAATA